MLAGPIPFLTWRESVVGMKPTEMVQLELRRTWDVVPKVTPSLNGDSVARAAGGVNSQTLGFVRWSMKETTLFNRPVRLLKSEAYDRKTRTSLIEEVWTSLPGDIVRQREERATLNGREIGEAAFYEDRIELTRTDLRGKSTFAALYPANGMAEVQARFKAMTEPRKEFLKLDALTGAFRKVLVERTGRFKGNWGGDAYDGPAYRFTIDGKEQTLMITPEDEVVQIGLDKETAFVLMGTTKSRRKGGF